MHLLLAVFLLATPAKEERATVVALPELRTFNLDPKLESFFAEHLAVQLKLRGLQVVTRREVETMLGMERQRQLLGCGESGSCMAELADALGADGAVIGDIARIGKTFQVNLKVIAGRDGRTLAAFSEGANSEDAMLEVLTRAAAALAEPTFRNLGRTPPSNISVVTAAPNLRSAAWAPLGLGVLLSGAGVTGLVLAANTRAELSAGKPPNDEEAGEYVRRGQTQEALGITGLALGGAALATGFLFLAFGPSTPIVPSAAPLPGGMALILTGELP